ncbi:MAG TPA: MarC family protein [Bryobacteraceae bacterium]|nr:MarC family protein [Bryobacteraceae bacterium]
MAEQFGILVRIAVLVVATLLPLINPAGSAAIFHSMTLGIPDGARRKMAWQIGLNSFFLVVAATFIGSYVLDFFGVSLTSVRIGGGLLVAASGWKLLNADEKTGQKSADLQNVASRTFYPLTFPLTVGPGTISAAITIGASLKEPGVVLWQRAMASVVGLAAVAFTVYLSFRFAARLIEFLGDTGTVVMLRLSAFILMCVGVQITINGVLVVVQSIPHS